MGAAASAATRADARLDAPSLHGHTTASDGPITGTGGVTDEAIPRQPSLRRARSFHASAVKSSVAGSDALNGDGAGAPQRTLTLAAAGAQAIGRRGHIGAHGNGRSTACVARRAKGPTR